MMLGGMLAGHSESGGEVIEKNGTKYKLFYGMSSDTAMKKHAGGVAEYRSESPSLWYTREQAVGPPDDFLSVLITKPEGNTSILSFSHSGRQRGRRWKLFTKVRWT